MSNGREAMITQETQLRTLPLPPVRAIQIAWARYQEWGGADFMSDLDDYLVHGVVIARPDLFGLAKVIEDPGHDGEPAWFIRMAVGKLSELLEALPPYQSVKRICFCRHKKTGQLDQRLRTYSLERARHLSKLRENFYGRRRT